MEFFNFDESFLNRVVNVGPQPVVLGGKCDKTIKFPDKDANEPSSAEKKATVKASSKTMKFNTLRK